MPQFFNNNRRPLWNIWHGILLFGLYCYLAYNSISRYLEFKRSVLNPRFGGQWSYSGMNFYLGMLIAALAFFPFIIYSVLLRVGNYASDGDLIGRDTDNLSLVRDLRGVIRYSNIGERELRSTGSCIRLRRHFLPMSSFFHVISAFCMLIPIPVLHGQMIARAQRRTDHIWQSDIGFILKPRSYSDDLLLEKDHWIEGLPVSPEFFNLCLALLLLTIRYPAAFWYTNRPFSLVFSLLAVVASLHAIFDINAAGVLHKLAHYREYPDADNGIHQTIAELKPPLLYPGIALALSSVGSILSLLLLCLVFEYGYHHFLSNLDSSTSASHGGVHSPSYSKENRKNSFSKRYLLPTGAMSSIIVPTLLKSPIMWDCAYYKELSPIFLINIVIGCIFLSLWLIIWMGLLIKNDWKFEVHIPVQTVSEIYASGVATNGNGSVNNNGSIASKATGLGRLDHRDRLESSNDSPMYALFPEMEEGSAASGGVPMSPGLHSTDGFSEDTDASSRGGSNYVFLQSEVPSMNQAPLGGHGGAYGTGQDLPSGLAMDEESQSSYTSSQTPQQVEMPTIDEDDDRPTTGVLKYAVSRGSFRSTNHYVREPELGTNPDDAVVGPSPTGVTMMGTGSLNRNSRFRKSGNRVTFKEDPIPGSSPNSGSLESGATVASNDSGIMPARKRSISEAIEFPANDSVVIHHQQQQLHASHMPDDPPYYNQADFAAADYDARYAVQPRRRSVDVLQESPQPLPIVTPRSPFNSLKRQRITDAMTADEQRLCSQV